MQVGRPGGLEAGGLGGRGVGWEAGGLEAGGLGDQGASAQPRGPRCRGSPVTHLLCAGTGPDSKPLWL